MSFDWRYGLHGHEFSVGTFIEWNELDGYGYCRSPRFKDKFLVREKEILAPCGPFFVSTDDVSKNVKIGDTVTCSVIECTEGLIGLSAKKTGTNIGDEVNWDGVGTDSCWPGGVNITRFIGGVQHFNGERAFGFIDCDQIAIPIFFQKREILVPYRDMANPMEAVSIKVRQGDRVTFDVIQTQKGIRALGVKRWKDIKNIKEDGE